MNPRFSIKDRSSMNQVKPVGSLDLDYLRSLFDHVDDFMFSVNLELKITSWNSSIEQVSGYAVDEVINREIRSLGIFDHVDELENMVKRVNLYGSVGCHHLVLLSKKGVRKNVLVHSPITRCEDEKQDDSVFLIGRDVTSQYDRLRKLKRGYGHLLIDEEVGALSLLTLLSEMGYRCLVVSCCNSACMNRVVFPFTVQVVSFHCNDEISGGVSDLDELISVIKEGSNFSGNTVVLLLNFEYLLSLYSFDQLLHMVYEVNDVVDRASSLCIVHVSDQLVFSEKQLRSLRYELVRLSSKSAKDRLPDLQLFDLLKVLHKRKNCSTGLSFTLLKRELKVSFPTIRKHTRYLEESGCIIIMRKGQKKIVRLTKQGEKIVERFKY